MPFCCRYRSACVVVVLAAAIVIPVIILTIAIIIVIVVVLGNSRVSFWAALLCATPIPVLRCPHCNGAAFSALSKD